MNGLRKWWLFVGLQGISVGLLMAGKMDIPAYVDLTKWTFGPVVLAITGERFGLTGGREAK